MIIGEKEPTVIPPNLYKKRFRVSMDSYFITVSVFSKNNKKMPDRYFQLKMIGKEQLAAICVFVCNPIVLFMSSEISPIPHNLNALRACKLCKLVKNYDEVGLNIVNQPIVSS